MVSYDSGGQPEFYVILPLLSTNPTGYIMVFDMSKDLSVPIQNTVCRGNIEVPSQNEHEITTIDLLKSAIAGIQPYSGDTDCHLMVVGTYLDKYDNPEERIPKLDQQIYSELVEGNAESILTMRQQKKESICNREIDRTEIIYPVANLMEGTVSNWQNFSGAQ